MIRVRSGGRLTAAPALCAAVLTLAACGGPDVVGGSSVPPTPTVSPDACSLLQASDVKAALGADVTGLYSVHGVPAGAGTKTAGQCTYTAVDGAQIVVTVFPDTAVASLGSYVAGANKLGPALVNESDKVGQITIAKGTAAVAVTLARSDVDTTTRTALLAALARAVSGAVLPAVPTPGPSASASASATPGATAQGPGQPVSGQTATATVQETDSLKFSPASSSIKVGQVVEWDNGSTVAHNVTFDQYSSITSDTMNIGDKYQVKFTQAGTYQYHCTFHPGMDGTITVGS